MKKRDYYILGFLLCLVVYCSFHRKNSQDTTSSNEAMVDEQQLPTPTTTSSVDSIQPNKEPLLNAGV
ncbi:hypothetical protein ACRTDU_13130 [Sunxiuqinia elliptica]|uniref:hypothetical protein n=1 Tax=Sunxiuqinia elliptica TaxID=655355 RepID=UPI0011143E67|nr:hypothetical protein [Sunxiuqinia elliptica]